MLINGEWLICEDGIVRPIVRGRVQAASGDWVVAERDYSRLKRELGWLGGSVRLMRASQGFDASKGVLTYPASTPLFYLTYCFAAPLAAFGASGWGNWKGARVMVISQRPESSSYSTVTKTAGVELD
jgi:hypothetical protein